MRRRNVFGRVRLSVCLSVSSSSDFRKPWSRRLVFGMPVRLHNIQVKFVCQGHRVKVKVKGANNRVCMFWLRMTYRRLNGNLVLQTFPITSVKTNQCETRVLVTTLPLFIIIIITIIIIISEGVGKRDSLTRLPEDCIKLCCFSAWSLRC